MSAVLVSLFILGASVAALVVWVHGACQAIYTTRFEQDYSEPVARALQLQYASVRQALWKKEALGGKPALSERSESNGKRDPLGALQRDYQALTYLMRRISCSRSGPYSNKLRLLRLDFQLLRLATGALRLLSADAWRATLVDMTRVLEYFSQVTGQRLQASASLFAAVPAGGPGSTLLGICSYCRYVRTPAENSTEKWMPSESYQEKGGSTDVVLSHGICPECFDHLVRPTSA
jgi:hypothetical protein